ncbi:transcriptional regulator [Veronia nyctiphanis]|uniref:Transcriptional regulator n=1 Tax=Veronia nyctiphanis TaxID=1278244 RepID=A0A4Q0YMQ7_9GAMM|nr:helix-turn-helix transcriptional regulator [Veronia nyctiphanis]RXJ72172.1 transcriptional regulator [Veronia nyctiphanis]
MVIVKSQVAQRIRQAREYRNFTQMEVAQRLEVARQTYLDIESGKTEPKISSLVTIAEITGRPLNWFLYGESSRGDIAFTYREELGTLMALIGQLPVSARDLVVEQALGMAEYLLAYPSSSDR